MPQTYRITAPSGQTLRITGDHVPTESELTDIFQKSGVSTGAVQGPKPIDHSEPRMSAAYPGSGSSPEAVAEHAGYRVPDAGGGHWQSTAGSELHREDNSVLGMPPEFAAISAMAVARAAAAPATNVLLRAKAALGAVAETATPIIKYEATKAGLEGVGVPPALATVIAMGVSGYKMKGKPTDAPAPVLTGEKPAVPMEAPLDMTRRRLKAENIAKAGGIDAAKAQLTPTAAPAPVAAAPVAAEAFTPSPLQKMFGMKPGVEPSPTQLSSSIRLAEIRAKVTLTAAEKDGVAQLVKQGVAPEAALTKVLPTPTVDPAEALRQRLGLPSADEAAAAVQERNRTGRWPGSPNGKQIAAKADPPADGGIYVKWSPIPNRPWGVHEPNGRVIKRFDTPEQANAYAAKSGK